MFSFTVKASDNSQRIYT
ncbi:hypothetical protein O3G_MSEX001189 [Manduca sexta]|uniref:Uncharacterized protein n=1 Tax=Manduca sexta TaxID=7130 RepID=A0A921YJH0_MANSE|nr:hypothetical protein O3G_MSEX001189 [Manduca sexta]